MKKSNIFITINLLFILGCCIFYGSRLLYFYRLENPKKIKQMETLEKMISHKGNIIVSGDGLYQNNEEYIFKGKNTNNYLEYDGRLWRIVKMSKNGDIKLITEDAQTSLVWGIDDNFEESYVYDWLNNEKSKIKPFVS